MSVMAILRQLGYFPPSVLSGAGGRVIFYLRPARRAHDYWPSRALMAAAILAFMASRLNEAGSCMGG